MCGKQGLMLRDESDLRWQCARSLIGRDTPTAEARPEKVIVNGLFVFIEFAQAVHAWLRLQSALFPQCEMRERDSTGPKGRSDLVVLEN